MDSRNKTKSQLIEEVTALKQRVRVLEGRPGSAGADPVAQGDQMFEKMFDGIAILRTSDKARLFVNDAFVEMSGYADRAEALADSAFTRVHPDDREMVKNRAFGNVIPKQLTTYRLLRPDGTIKHVYSARSNVTYASEPAELVVVRDVSELIEREQQYRTVVDNMDDGILVTRRGQRVLMNDAFLRIYISSCISEKAVSVANQKRT